MTSISNAPATATFSHVDGGLGVTAGATAEVGTDPLGGADPTHDSHQINFGGPTDKPTATDLLSPTLDPMSQTGPADPIQQLIQMIMMILQMLMQMLGMDPSQLTDDGSGDAGTAPAGGSGGASGVGGGGGGGGGDKSLGFDENGELQIGEGWGGWDGVSDGAKGSSHDVEDRAALVGMLQSDYGLSDGEAHQVAQTLHSSSTAAGLDATKGQHSDAQAADIKTQNHANIKQVFSMAPPGSSASDLMGAIGSVYG